MIFRITVICRVVSVFLFLVVVIFFSTSYECGEQPIVSVVIPVYNKESSVLKCLSSILNQTLECIEAIFVDDGSVDGSLEVLERFAKVDKRMVVIHQENCGVSCARNTGLNVVKGRYVSFVDSDDWVELNAFEIAFEKAEKYDADVVIWGFVKENKKMKRSISAVEKLLHGVDAARMFLPIRTSVHAIWNKMFKSSLLKRNNISFDTSLKSGEDLLFNLDLVPVVNSVLLLNKTLYHYNPSFILLDFKKENRKISNGILKHLDILSNSLKFKELIGKEEMDEIRSLANFFKRNRRHLKKKKK